MRTVDRFRNWRALAWAMGIMALLGAMATTRHHFQMMDSMNDAHLTWMHAISQEAPPWIFWALSIPVVFFFVDRVARQRWSWGTTVLAHVTFGGFAALAATAFHAFVYDMSFPEALLTNGTTELFTYAPLLAGVLAYYYAQRSVDREIELAGARLNALQAQLRPHFMFNALNSAAMLVRGGRGPEAVEMIARLSGLLRDSLDEDHRKEVTLAEEVALARRYLAIEEVRFADRLAVSVHLTEAAQVARVPRLILQPIVENAVRHGVGQRVAAGCLDINARTTDHELIVAVCDDGPGPNGDQGDGLGLRNTRERLATMYGATARLTLEHGPQGGAVATLVIPLQ